jgi:hypothetical protein
MIFTVEPFAKRRVCHSRSSHRESSPRKINEFWIPASAGMTTKLANGSFCKRLGYIQNLPQGKKFRKGTDYKWKLVKK